MAGGEGARRKRIQIVAGYSVVQKFHGMSDKTGGIRNGGIVSRLKGSIDSRKSERSWVQAAARTGDRSHGKKVEGDVSGFVGGGVRSAVVENRAIISARLNRMLPFHPGYIVDCVVRGNVDNTGRIGGAVRA